MKTFKKIVVATDFSDSAKSAYHYAQQLAVRFGASIEVVNFFEVPINPANPNYMEMMPTFRQLEEAADSRLARFVNESENGQGTTLVSNRVQTTFKTQAGFPSDGLIECSKDPSVDLIILGATGEHGWMDKILGSTAGKVSREAYCPVMLVPHGTQYRGIHHMVYTSTFESVQPREIKVAIDFAKYFASAIHFVHVITELDDSGISEKLLLGRLGNEAHTNVAITVENVTGFTAFEGINNYILNNETDMLVTVTHHRSFWEKLTHFSTTKELAWNIHVPLLVLHYDEKSQPPV
jgi:nucleotide-binding universal stress UspA family protein